MVTYKRILIVRLKSQQPW